LPACGFVVDDEYLFEDRALHVVRTSSKFQLLRGNHLAISIPLNLGVLMRHPMRDSAHHAGDDPTWAIYQKRHRALEQDVHWYRVKDQFYVDNNFPGNNAPIRKTPA